MASTGATPTGPAAAPRQGLKVFSEKILYIHLRNLLQTFQKLVQSNVELKNLLPVFPRQNLSGGVDWATNPPAEVLINSCVQGEF